MTTNMASRGSVVLPATRSLLRLARACVHQYPCLSQPICSLNALLGKQITFLEKAIENSAVLQILH